MQASEALEYCKKSLLDESCQSAGHQHLDMNMDSKGQAQGISVENKDSIGHWIKGQMCYTMADNFFLFCPCSKTLLETEF